MKTLLLMALLSLSGCSTCLKFGADTNSGCRVIDLDKA